jgi:4-amino-4-deoxy-L-arabinose transferase-like glycosyltransferase
LSGIASETSVADEGRAGATLSTWSILRLVAFSRALIWAAIVLVWLVSESYGNPLDHADPRSHDGGYLLDALARWDTGWLLGIADKGYSLDPNASAFFPLYSAIVGVLGRILLRNFLLAAVIVSLAACAGSFLLLYRLAVRLIGVEAAGRSVLYLAVFPTTLFLGVAYTESLFLVLTLAAFLFAERRQWTAAGVVSGLAILTRSSGVALLFALPLLAWKSSDRRRALAGLATALPIGALYPLYLWIREGGPFVFMTAQRDGWGRRVGEPGPVTGIGRGLSAGFQGVRQLIAGPDSSRRYWNWASDTTVPRAALLSVFFAVALIVFAWLSVVAWRRLGAAYGVFSVVSLLIPLSAPTGRWPLLSLPRFGVTIFPFFLALALVGGRRSTHSAIVWISATLAFVVISQWASFYFIS